MGPPLPPLQSQDYPRREWEGGWGVQVFRQGPDNPHSSEVRPPEWYPGRGQPHACFSGKFPGPLPPMVNNRRRCINQYWSNSFWGKSFEHSCKKKKTTRKKACIILGGIHVPCWRFAYWLFAINPSGSFISLHFYSGIFMESQKVAKRVQRLPVDPPSSHPTGYISRNYSPLPKPGNWPGYCACVVLCHFMTCIDSWKCQPSRDADLLHHHP